MICSSCVSTTLLGKFENSIVCRNPADDQYLKEMFADYMILHKGGKCSLCNRNIVPNEPAYEEESKFINKLEIKLGEIFTSKIVCCNKCETGEVFENFSYSMLKECDDEEEKEVLKFLSDIDSSQSIEDLLNDYFYDDAWLDYYEEIASNIHCPNCKNGSGEDYEDKIDYGSFNVFTEIYTQSDQDRFNKRFYGIKEKSDKYIESISEAFSFDEIEQIIKDYKEGKKMCSSINELEAYIHLLRKKGIKVNLSSNRLLYRTRPHGGLKGYLPTELWEPPMGSATRGRYNATATSVLYLSNNIDTIKVEVPRKSSETYSIGKFLINKDMCCFPVNAVFTGNYANFVSSKQSIDKKQYILTNLISIMCEKIGYDGIAYYSTKKNEFVNYAIFCKYTRGIELDCIDAFDET